MKTFNLLDDTLLAEGVVFTDGTTVVRWVVGPHQSTVVWPTFDAFEAISGHGPHDPTRRIQWLS